MKLSRTQEVSLESGNFHLEVDSFIHGHSEMYTDDFTLSQAKSIQNYKINEVGWDANEISFVLKKELAMDEKIQRLWVRFFKKYWYPSIAISYTNECHKTFSFSRYNTIQIFTQSYWLGLFVKSNKLFAQLFTIKLLD